MAIKTEAEYESTLSRLDEIFDALPGTLEGDEADILALLIEDYENEFHFIEAPKP